MAYLLVEVESIKDAGKEKTIYKELEGIIFRDDEGKEIKFKIGGILPQSTKWMKMKFPGVEWDNNCLHFAFVVGSEIKE